MELPQPRPFGAEGKKPTHDFLSLYSDPSFQPQDPRSSQGFYLRTHDFLQPLERSGKSNCIEETREKPLIEKPPSVEHILPGGIGTYSISQIPTFGRTVAVKTDKNVYSVVQACGQERNGEVSNANSNSSPCNGGAFTLWGESAVKEKTMMKDKMGESQITREPSEKLAQYPPFASRASSFNPMMTPSNQFQGGQKNQGFMEMLRSVKGLPEDEDDDEDDYVKKEVTSHKEDFGVKVDGKGNDQRANTPRSKHSATEQRRRSKINDRFQILRQLIPHSDQKRDKASFLLEVIEYIQFLQEKVQKYEAAFPGCNQDITKFSPWKHSHGTGESIVDHSQIKKSGGAGSGLMFAGKFEDNGVAVTSSMLGNAQNPVESDNVSSDTPYKATDHHPGLATKAATAAVPLQQSVYNTVGRNSGIIPPQNRFLSDAENMASQPQQHLWQRSVPADSGMSNEQEELTIEGGTIHLSSVYSQGLLSSLTKALQSSGIDLSQANVSVQIDLGKRAITRPGNTSSAKDHEDPLSCNRTMAHSRGASSADDSDQVQKRPRIDRR